MFIPLRTDRYLRHTPWVNRSLILINIVVFLAQFAVDSPQGGEPWFRAYMLEPGDPKWYQFFTYAFLHGDVWHLASNMIFLFVFGHSVEDRLRPWGYALFYCVGAMAAGFAEFLAYQPPTEPSPVVVVLGASGAVSAVTGAFLALFPKTRITVLFVFVLIAFFEVPSMYIIFFYFLKDLMLQGLGAGGTAYMTHIGGTLYGFSVGMALLGLKILPREPYDFMALAKHWNRRRQFKTQVGRGMEPWAGHASKQMEGKLTETEKKISSMRQEVFDALGRTDNLGAAQAYERLLGVDTDQVLPKIQQADLANRAIQAEQYATAAAAYRRLLEKYPQDSESEEARLMLALVLHRYLGQSEEAIAHLRPLASNMADPQHRQLAEQLLAEAEHVTDPSQGKRFKF